MVPVGATDIRCPVPSAAHNRVHACRNTSNCVIPMGASHSTKSVTKKFSDSGGLECDRL